MARPRKANKLSQAERNRRYTTRHPERVRERGRLRYYGMKSGEYEAMCVAQKGMCAICNTVPVGEILCVDHDHYTGQIRGLLCRKCNAGVGLLMDSAYLLEKAAAYINSYAKHQSAV